MPTSKPDVSQNSIDLAMLAYAIKLPVNCRYPQLDKKLSDRGLTYKKVISPESLVFIGPPAFETWALLGSTIAHEVEVHCNQSFYSIWSKDKLGLNGTCKAEREAYQYELDNSKRFNLSAKLFKDIEMTMEYFYKECK